MRLRRLMTIGLSLLVASGPWSAAARDETKSRYPAIAAEIQAMGLKDKRSLNISPWCDLDPFGPSPCEESLRHFKAWTEKHGLPRSSHSALAFRSFATRDYATADKLFARLMGHTTEAYDKIAREVAALGLTPWDGRKESCENNYFSANPCKKAVRLWKEWAAKNGLPLDYHSAGVFQAYLRGDTRQGHIQYALARGYPPPDIYEGPGNGVLALGLRSYDGRDRTCENNYFAPNPCPRAIRLWKEWAAQHELELSYQSAAIFQAYVNRDFRTGDRLYGIAKGEATGQPEYAGPGLDVVTLGIQPWDPARPQQSIKEGCRVNPFAIDPCGGHLGRVVREWAERNGLPFDGATAAVFEAYNNYDFERGDRLYASAKGITVEELMREYRGPSEEELQNRLVIDVYPAGS